MYDVKGTGPVASPIEATRWAAPSARSCSTTGWGCSRKSPWPARNAATASGAGRVRSIRTRPASTPCRRSTVSMHCQGVGASANDRTVRPIRSVHANAGRGARPTRKKPFRLHTSAKCTTIGPERSASSKLRISPPRLISMSPSSRAGIVPLPKAAAASHVTSRPSSRKCPSATPAGSGA